MAKKATEADPSAPAHWPSKYMPVTSVTALPLAKWLSEKGLSQERIAGLFGVSQSSISRYLAGAGGKIVEQKMVELHGPKKPEERVQEEPAPTKPQAKQKAKRVSRDDTDKPAKQPVGSYCFATYMGGGISYSQFWSQSVWRRVSALDMSDVPDEFPAVYEFGLPGPDGKVAPKYVGKATACFSGKTTGYARKRFGQYTSKADTNKNNPEVVRGFRDPGVKMHVRWRCVVLPNDPSRAGARGVVAGVEAELLALYLGDPYEWNKRG